MDPLRRRSSKHATVPALLLALLGLVAAGCGSSAAPPHATAVAMVRTKAPVALKPEVPVDAEADQGFPLPAGVHGTRAAPRPGAAPAAPRRAPSSATASRISPGAPSDEEVRAELQEMHRVLHAWHRSAQPPAVAKSGLAEVSAGLPDAVAHIIAGGNAIARFPYVYGGGHASFVDNAYDCSASVSYALAAAGLLDRPLTSGQLARWGAPGPGRWITIYANAGHTFMYVNGLRFDTSGRAGAFGSRWQTARRSLAGFTVRHPPGL